MENNWAWSNPPELIKEDGQDLKKVIYEIVLRIREQELTPQEWKCGMMCTFHKKGGGGRDNVW
jgi:hypothetical protein